jgi:hypothetical protein
LQIERNSAKLISKILNQSAHHILAPVAKLKEILQRINLKIFSKKFHQRLSAKLKEILKKLISKILHP